MPLDTSTSVEALNELRSLHGEGHLQRRGFMLGSLSAGFAASVAPSGVLLAQTMRTDNDGLSTGEIKIKTKSGEIPGYFAKPAGRLACPTVLVVHEIFGVHEHIRDVCRRLAKTGLMAVAPELFARHADVSQMSNAAEIINNVVPKVPDQQVLDDLDASAAWAQSHGGSDDKLGITGFCWGGRVTWLYAAHQPQVKAAVAWYGRLTGSQNAMNPSQPLLVADVLHAPVLGLYGGADPGIGQESIDDMRERLTLGGKPSLASNLIVYPDTPHAFHADYRPSYRAAPAADGWARCLAWLKGNGLV
jgi:carboxymethylenebutenolidase